MRSSLSSSLAPGSIADWRPKLSLWSGKEIPNGFFGIRVTRRRPIVIHTEHERAPVGIRKRRDVLDHHEVGLLDNSEPIFSH